MIDIGVILGAYQLARIIGELTGMCESIGVKVDRLAGSELQAAFRSLDQAQRSTSERTTLLRAARDHVNKAVSLEKEERLAAAYLALAVTHGQLGDEPNKRSALHEFVKVEYLPTARMISEALKHAPEAALKGAVAAGIAQAILIPFVGLNLAAYEASWVMLQLTRLNRIDELKASVREYLQTQTA